jgi:hypothetical protein
MFLTDSLAKMSQNIHFHLYSFVSEHSKHSLNFEKKKNIFKWCMVGGRLTTTRPP